MSEEELKREMKELQAYLGSGYVTSMGMTEIKMLKDRVFNLEQQLFELTCMAANTSSAQSPCAQHQL